MAQNFVGKWNLVDSENFDEYMKTVGVGFMTRKIGATVKPVLTVSVNGDHWKMLSESTFKNLTTEFDLGKEFEETTADGRTMKSTFTLENGKLMQKQLPIKAEDKASNFERYVEGSKLIMVMESEGVKAKRVYERAQ